MFVMSQQCWVWAPKRNRHSYPVHPASPTGLSSWGLDLSSMVLELFVPTEFLPVSRSLGWGGEPWHSCFLLKYLIIKRSSIETEFLFLCWHNLHNPSEWHQGHSPEFPWCQCWPLLMDWIDSQLQLKSETFSECLRWVNIQLLKVPQCEPVI